MLLSFSLTDSSFFSHSHTTFSFIPSLSLFFLSFSLTHKSLSHSSLFLSFLVLSIAQLQFPYFLSTRQRRRNERGKQQQQASSIGVGGAIWTSKCVVYIQHRCLLCMFNDSRMGSNKEAIEAKAKLEKARDVCSDFREKNLFHKNSFCV